LGSTPTLPRRTVGEGKLIIESKSDNAIVFMCGGVVMTITSYAERTSITVDSESQCESWLLRMFGTDIENHEFEHVAVNNEVATKQPVKEPLFTERAVNNEVVIKQPVKEPLFTEDEYIDPRDYIGYHDMNEMSESEIEDAMKEIKKELIVKAVKPEFIEAPKQPMVVTKEPQENNDEYPTIMSLIKYRCEQMLGSRSNEIRFERDKIVLNKIKIWLRVQKGYIGDQRVTTYILTPASKGDKETMPLEETLQYGVRVSCVTNTLPKNASKHAKFDLERITSIINEVLTAY